MNTGRSWSDARTLALFLVAWAVARALPVLALGDVFFYLEEKAKGALARALLLGAPVPYRELVGHPFEGGSFVASHVRALFFAALGPSVLATKLAAIAWGAAIVAAGWHLVRRHFGRRAAIAFGLLVVLAPEDLQKISLLHVGNHWESTLFVLLALDGLIALGVGEARRPRSTLLTGLAAGFGAYFSYQVLLVLAPVALWAAVRRPRLSFGRSGAWLLAGFVVGLGPWWAMLAVHGAGMLDVHGQSLLARSDNAGRLAAMLRSLWVGHSAREIASTFGLPLTALGACAWLLTSAARPVRERAVPLALSLAVWSITYASSTFVLGDVYHYFVLARLAPAWMLALLLLAAALGQAWESEHPAVRRAALGALALLAMLGLVDLASICAAGRPGSPRENLALLAGTRGYDYEHYLALLLERDQEPLEQLRLWSRLAEPRDLLLEDLGSAGFRDASRELASVLADLGSVAPGEVDALARGLGPYLAARSAWDALAALELACGADASLRPALAEAAGRFGSRFGATPAELELEIPRVLGRPCAADWLRGAGRRLWRRHVLGVYGGPGMILRPDRALELIERQPPAARPLLLEGFEHERALRSLR